MPRSRWTNKDERQYEHVKQSELERGRSTRRATEIAARTVNKTRRKQGRTRKVTTSGTGNPNSALTERTKQELLNRARQLHIEGRSTMNKAELVRAVQSR